MVSDSDDDDDPAVTRPGSPKDSSEATVEDRLPDTSSDDSADGEFSTAPPMLGPQKALSRKQRRLLRQTATALFASSLAEDGLTGQAVRIGGTTEVWHADAGLRKVIQGAPGLRNRDQRKEEGARLRELRPYLTVLEMPETAWP